MCVCERESISSSYLFEKVIISISSNFSRSLFLSRTHGYHYAKAMANPYISLYLSLIHTRSHTQPKILEWGAKAEDGHSMVLQNPWHIFAKVFESLYLSHTLSWLESTSNANALSRAHTVTHMTRLRANPYISLSLSHTHTQNHTHNTYEKASYQTSKA